MRLNPLKAGQHSDMKFIMTIMQEKIASLNPLKAGQHSDWLTMYLFLLMKTQVLIP